MSEAESSTLAGISSNITVQRWDSFLVVLLAISLALNVFLGWKLKRFGVDGNSAPPVVLTEGTEVPSFEADDMSSKQETVICRGTTTVFYVFSSSCSWCDRNLENIKTLVRLRGDSYRFIGLSLGNTNLKHYLSSRELNFPVYTNLSKDTLQNLKLGSTPQTMVVSAEGRVIKNWVGAFGENLRADVERFFGVRLPGITSQTGQADGSDESCP